MGAPMLALRTATGAGASALAGCPLGAAVPGSKRRQDEHNDQDEDGCRVHLGHRLSRRTEDRPEAVEVNENRYDCPDGEDSTDN